MSTFKWEQEDIDKLIACESDEDYANSFPGKNLETLKRAKRRFRQADMALESSDSQEGAGQSDSVVPKGWQAGVEVTGDEGSICSGPVPAPVTNWEELLKIWGLDPEVFEVVGPPTFKAWDMGAKDADGNIQSKRMFSFKARIQKIVEAEFESSFDFSGWSESLKQPVQVQILNNVSPSTYVMCIADPQLGKPGTKEALASWKSGVLNHLAKVQAIRILENVERILVAFMGDEHEGVAGHYANQSYEIELSLSKQLDLDADMRIWTIKQAAELGLPVTVVSVISNHGEFTRQNGKVVTSNGDNSSTMVARMVKKVFDTTDLNIEWEIADEEPDVVLTTSGTKILFSHGHMSAGSGKSSEFRTKSAYEKQILGRTEELGDVTLFVTAHYHHHSITEDRGRTYIGCPALEAEKSSKWFFHKYGVWSKPGLLGFLVGDRFGDRGYASVDVM
jgi:hypothetical protein